MSENGNGSVAVLQEPYKGAIEKLKPHRFKPGQSGNPHGRPPKTTFLTLAKDTDLKLAYKKLVEAVRNGEAWAITLYLDEYLGKPTQRVEYSGDQDNPIRIEEVRAALITRIERHLTAVGVGEGN